MKTAAILIVGVVATILLAMHCCVDVGKWTPTPDQLVKLNKREQVLTSDAIPCDSDQTSQAWDDVRGHYNDLIERIETNSNVQAIILLLGIVLLARKETADKKVGRDLMEVVGVPVSRPWLHFILPAAAIWTWVHWGFLVNSALRDRVLLEAVNARLHLDHGPGDALRYVESIGLNDCAFMDTWFYCWRTDHSYDMSVNRVAKWLLAGATGAFIGAAHAVMIAVLLRGASCFKNEPGLSALCRVCCVVVPSLLIGSHIFFYLGAGPNKQQSIVALVGCAVLLLIMHYTERPPVQSPKA